MSALKKIILKNYGGLSVFVQDRQSMKQGHPEKQFVLAGRYPAFSLPIDWTKNNSLTFPMDGNDRYGDCLYAAACHADNTFTGNLGPESNFDLQSIINSYLQLSPSNSGLNSGQIIGAWKNGLANIPSAQILDALDLDPTNAAAMQAAIYLFGGVVFMLALPDVWHNSYGPGVIWNAPATPDPSLGHAVWWNGVDANGNYKLQTWGTYCWITTSGVKICDPSCFVVFSTRWFNSGGIAPNNLTYLQLAVLWQQFGGNTLPFRGKTVLPDTTLQKPSLTSFNGVLYIGYKGETNKNIYVTPSGNGQTFGNWSQLFETTTDAPALSSHSDGNLYVAFKAEMSRNVVVSRLIVSANGSVQSSGRAFLPDTTVAGPSLASYNGKLYVAYKGETNNNIYITSGDGQNFGGATQLSETTTQSPSLCVHTDANGSYLYLAFKAEMSNDLIVVKLNVGGNGSIQIASRKVIGETSTSSPTIASFNNNLYIAYKGETNNCVYLNSSNDGQNFINRFRSSETTTQAPALAVYNGSLFVGFKSETNTHLIVVNI